MALTLTVVSTKGGVGKTTLAANLAALLADIGQRILLVDADPPLTLSGYYPIAEMAGGSLTRLIVDASAEGTISRTRIGNLVVSDDPEGRLPVHRWGEYFFVLIMAPEPPDRGDLCHSQSQPAGGLATQSR